MFKKFVSTAAILLFAGSVFAASSVAENRSAARGHLASTRSDEGFMPAIGIGFGHLDQSGNSDAKGDGINAQLIGSYYFGNSAWIGDAGLGFQKQYFRGTDTQPTVGLLTLDGRYDFGNRFSAGPVADIIFGNGGDFGSANRYLTLLGVIGLKEFTLANDQMIRAGLKYDTQLGQSNQTNNYFGVVVQWGIGANNSYVKSASAY